jgi:uncharacterized protein DUF1893
MKDIDIAKELLEEEQLTLAIVKNGKIIFTGKEKGIKPLFTAVSELKEEIRGSSIADRVTGKAAAMLCVYAEIKELCTKVLSENAVEVLLNSSVLYEFEKSTPHIKNRDRTGMCPIETLSLKSNNIQELLLNISNFLEGIKKE